MARKGISQKEADRQEAIGYLKEILKPGDTVHTILRHVYSSGMSRRISTVIRTDTGIRDITYLVARVGGWKIGNKEGIRIGGCGMDMGFYLVYTLSRYLFPDGFKVEGRGRNGDMSGWDKDGGYALKQSWL